MLYKELKIVKKYSRKCNKFCW